MQDRRYSAKSSRASPPESPSWLNNQRTYAPFAEYTKASAAEGTSTLDQPAVIDMLKKSFWKHDLEEGSFFGSPHDMM